MAKYIQAVTTTDKKETAEKIARILVEKRLAACVQVIGPISSAYRWKGNIEQAEEWQCLIKSRQDLFAELTKTIKTVHNYETPEIIALEISAGSEDYMKWLDEEITT